MPRRPLVALVTVAALALPAAPAAARTSELAFSTGGAVVQPVREAIGPAPVALARLPRFSPWALPPVMRLRAPGAATRPTAAARRSVLHSGRLLLSPAARRAVRNGTLRTPALELLLRLPRVGSAYLVFGGSGRTVRVQATSPDMTHEALGHLFSLPTGERPGIALRPLSAGAADQKAPPGQSADIGQRAVVLAERFLGVPYVWGGASPSGMDCSGLTMMVYGALGIHLDHWTGFQWYEGTRIAPGALRAGDLVFFHPQSYGPGHVGIYRGDGTFIHAPRTGDVVKISSLSDPWYRANYMGAVRPY